MIEVSEQCVDKPLTIDCSLNGLSYERIVKRPNDNSESLCYLLKRKGDAWTVSTSYFIGVDWIGNQEATIRISPKFTDDNSSVEVDYLNMLETALLDPKNFEHLDGLLYVDFTKPYITIPKQNDALSLFLVSQYLHIIKQITKKGLKKAYYLFNENIHAVKGKIMIAQQIKKNIVRGALSKNYCRHQEYGVDIPENRLLKVALDLSQRLLEEYEKGIDVKHLIDIISTIRPAWKNVTNVEPSHVRDFNNNAFYKEYGIAIRLARMIIKRRSFNQVLHNTEMTMTPPYWIDMSKLFEMYVFEKLRNCFGNKVIYHPHFGKLEPDFLLLPDEKWHSFVIDAKYKRYADRSIDVDDIRQVVGYSRLTKVRERLEVFSNLVIPCLIIYPDQKSVFSLNKEFSSVNGYFDIFKSAIKLPTIP